MRARDVGGAGRRSDVRSDVTVGGGGARVVASVDDVIGDVSVVVPVLGRCAGLGAAVGARRRLVIQMYVSRLLPVYAQHTLYTVKNIRISTDILCPVFHILTEPVAHTFVTRKSTE